MDKLSRLAELIDAPAAGLPWGFFDVSTGYDPAAYSLMVFEPTIWTKTCLSLFTFSGAHTIRGEGKFTVVEIAAKFRAKLPPGDYPYPIWHTSRSWQSFVRTEAILLVFSGEELLAALGKSAPNAAEGEEAPPKWDGRWTWSDGLGRPQPRGATFAFAFSDENPELGAVSAAYSALEPKLRAYNCLSCHWPDNTAEARRQVVLGYPTHALAVYESLVPLLQRKDLKVDDPHADRSGGIPDKAAREELIRLAEAFQAAADHAISYEVARRAVE